MRNAITAMLVVLLELALAVVIVRWVLATHTSTDTQLAIVAGVLIGNLFRTWQRGRTARNADIAAALARGTGTYLLPNVKGKAPAQIGVPLSGIQPGAVQTYPDGTPMDRPLDHAELELASERIANPTPAATQIAAAYVEPPARSDGVESWCAECGWSDAIDGDQPHHVTHEAWLHARRVARGQI